MGAATMRLAAMPPMIPRIPAKRNERSRSSGISCHGLRGGRVGARLPASGTVTGAAAGALLAVVLTVVPAAAAGAASGDTMAAAAAAVVVVWSGRLVGGQKDDERGQGKQGKDKDEAAENNAQAHPEAVHTSTLLMR